MKIKMYVKKAIILMLMLGLVGGTLTVHANEDLVITELSLIEIIDNEEIQLQIENYLNTKMTTVAAINNFEETSILEHNGQLRAEGFQELETRLDVLFADTEIFSSIEEIIGQNEDELILKVYEWTKISYNATENLDCVDVMGYGTEHIMTFKLDNGLYTLVNDSFDERLITGVCTSDILEKEALRMAETELLEEIMINDAEYAINATSSANYDVNAAIEYANQWCGIPESARDWESGSQTGESTDNYNPVYAPHYSGADCANFVSQCLYEGGLETDSSWYVKSWTWVNAEGLGDHMSSVYGGGLVTSGGGNIYPGNPVYYVYGEDGNSLNGDSSGHQMICVGYNSAGVPVVNAHNTNAFRMPYTFMGNYTMRTAYIVDGDEHQHEPYSGYYYNSTSHYRICKLCQQHVNVATHQVVGSGTNRKCSVCGYTGPFASISCVEPEVE